MCVTCKIYKIIFPEIILTTHWIVIVNLQINQNQTFEFEWNVLILKTD